MKRRRILLILALPVLFLLGLGFYFFVEPRSDAFWYPSCIFYDLTGLRCPACGTQRALHALLHGHVLQAIRFNWFFLYSVPYVLVLMAERWVLSEGHLRERVRSIAEHRYAMFLYIALFFLWWIVRNIFAL